MVDADFSPLETDEKQSETNGPQTDGKTERRGTIEKTKQNKKKNKNGLRKSDQKCVRGPRGRERLLSQRRCGNFGRLTK